MNRVVVLPFVSPEEFEEDVKKLTWLKSWICFTNISYKYSPSDSTTITHDVGVDSSIFCPQLDTSQGDFEILHIMLDVF
jgi:hypothetical protein